MHSCTPDRSFDAPQFYVRVREWKDACFLPLVSFSPCQWPKCPLKGPWKLKENFLSWKKKKKQSATFWLQWDLEPNSSESKACYGATAVSSMIELEGCIFRFIVILPFCTPWNHKHDQAQQYHDECVQSIASRKWAWSICICSAPHCYTTAFLYGTLFT